MREKTKTVYVCSHDGFPGCNVTLESKAAMQYHERRHEMDSLIDRISDVHDHQHFVQEEVIEFLEGWLEHGTMAGLVECDSCGADVHATFDQCPECLRPVHPLSVGATLECGECGSHRMYVYQKQQNRRKQGYRCADCNTFVADGDGMLSFWSNKEHPTMGHWNYEDNE